ncbi:diguanylate cyclase (GGDEF)-like protein [Paucibacter oligotrophus]|uniref:Diguanylate cyclase (GGDEF)-like protein n=1 Tax=Roseateles oligotrophus TaxID=1769250 RepID=A0A840L7Z9_9BURK|nr:EAL domain-containing protein [Roseateles oligotrophus]MBB4842792.1 diguanylate cyclase (GGDEF)-like protein [Roseateles oligotrophus]
MQISLNSRIRLPARSEALAETVDLDRPVGAIRRSYFLALAILALLALGNYLVINAMLREQAHAVALNEVAISQRSDLRRVAQIVELILRTQDQNPGPGGQRWLAATREELARLAGRLESSQEVFDQALLRDQGLRVSWLKTPLIDTGRAQRFSAMTRALAQQLRKFAALDAGQVEWRFSVWAPLELALAADGLLMSEVNAITSDLYRHALHTAQRFQRLHLALAGITLLTLLAEYLLIFHPMLQGLRQSNQRIRQITEQLRHQANHDLLTDVGNRRLLRATLEALERAPQPSASHALLLLDIDKFRKTNELFGHAAGDHALRALAERLQDCLRPSDHLFRSGGNEFTIVLQPAPPDPPAMQAVLDGLAEAVVRPLRFQNQAFQISACLGAASAGLTGDTQGDLLGQADFALRMAKQAGPGSRRVFDRNDAGISAARERMAVQLNQALQRGQIKAHYQPVVDVHSQRILGVEALARWVREDGAVLTPAEFLPVVQEFGMLDRLTEAMLQAVLDDRLLWREQAVMPGFVSVNFPEVSLSDQYLLPRLQAMAGDEGLAWLQVEVLETALLCRASERIECNLHGLAELGVRVVLDDFGTGYASLSHLRRLPCHSIKIDQSFVAAMQRDAGSLLIVRGMIDMALGLGLKVTVEGIENLAQHQVFLAFAGVRGQGHFYARAQSPQALSQLLRANAANPAQPASTLASTGAAS